MSSTNGAGAVAADPLAAFTHLARASLLLESLQQESLGPLGLSFVEYSVLRVVDLARPERRLPPSRLAELVVRTTGGMTKIVDRLERRGLVRRVPDPADRRGVLVELTGEGLALSRSASEAYRRGRRRVLRALGDDEVAAIDAGLRRLVEVLENDRKARR